MTGRSAAVVVGTAVCTALGVAAGVPELRLGVGQALALGVFLLLLDGGFLGEALYVRRLALEAGGQLVHALGHLERVAARLASELVDEGFGGEGGVGRGVAAQPPRGQVQSDRHMVDRRVGTILQQTANQLPQGVTFEQYLEATGRTASIPRFVDMAIV